MEWMAAARHTPVLTLISGEKEEYGFSCHLFINTMIKLLLIILYKAIERLILVKAAGITVLKCWCEFIVGM
jgi:hypothetical protein